MTDVARNIPLLDSRMALVECEGRCVGAQWHTALRSPDSRGWWRCLTCGAETKPRKQPKVVGPRPVERPAPLQVTGIRFTKLDGTTYVVPPPKSGTFQLGDVHTYALDEYKLIEPLFHDPNPKEKTQ
jgi:hypothetical protein